MINIILRCAIDYDEAPNTGTMMTMQMGSEIISPYLIIAALIEPFAKYNSGRSILEASIDRVWHDD